MSAYEYAGPFADDIRAFLEFKASVGIYAESRDWTLSKFDKWCAENGATDFDKETVEAWARQWRAHLAPTNTQWMSYIRQLGKFMVANGKDAYVLSDEFKAVFHRAEPYLLTEDEVERFFESAASLEVRSPWAWQATCFFGLMSACGLRTGECRRLQVGDIGWDGCCIDIAESKANRGRRLPVTDEVMEMLAACDSRTRVELGGKRGAFFVVSSGTPSAKAASAGSSGAYGGRRDCRSARTGSDPAPTTSGTGSPTPT